MSVDAYIPRSGFQVERIAQRRNDLKSAIVDSEVTLFEDNEPTSTRFYERSIVDYTSRKYQSVATQSSGTSIFEISRQLEPQSAKHPALMSLLFENDPRSLKLALIGLGIPVLTDAELKRIQSPEDRRAAEKTRIARIDLSSAKDESSEEDKKKEKEISFYYVTGKERELWVTKDSFLPFRVQWIDPKTRSLFVVEFSNYRFSDGFAFPSLTRFKANDQIIMEIKSNKPQVNLQKLKFLDTVRNGLTSTGIELDEDYRRLVKMYYQIFR